MPPWLSGTILQSGNFQLHTRNPLGLELVGLPGVRASILTTRRLVSQFPAGGHGACAPVLVVSNSVTVVLPAEGSVGIPVSSSPSWVCGTRLLCHTAALWVTRCPSGELPASLDVPICSAPGLSLLHAPVDTFLLFLKKRTESPPK